MLSDMRDRDMTQDRPPTRPDDSRPRPSKVFADPVAYLAAFGISAEVVEEPGPFPTLAVAA